MAKLIVAFRNFENATNKASPVSAIREIKTVFILRTVEHANTLRGQNTDFLKFTAV